MTNKNSNLNTATQTVTEYQRSYREQNPEKVLRWRLHQAANLLTKHGYTVTAPTEGGATV